MCFTTSSALLLAAPAWCRSGDTRRVSVVTQVRSRLRKTAQSRPRKEKLKALRTNYREPDRTVERGSFRSTLSVFIHVGVDMRIKTVIALTVLLAIA